MMPDSIMPLVFTPTTASAWYIESKYSWRAAPPIGFIPALGHTDTFSNSDGRSTVCHCSAFCGWGRTRRPTRRTHGSVLDRMAAIHERTKPTSYGAMNEDEQ